MGKKIELMQIRLTLEEKPFKGCRNIYGLGLATAKTQKASLSGVR